VDESSAAYLVHVGNEDPCDASEHKLERNRSSTHVSADDDRMAADRIDV
jgi:hypothetical protein